MKRRGNWCVLFDVFLKRNIKKHGLAFTLTPVIGYTTGLYNTKIEHSFIFMFLFFTIIIVIRWENY